MGAGRHPVSGWVPSQLEHVIGQVVIAVFDHRIVEVGDEADRDQRVPLRIR